MGGGVPAATKGEVEGDGVGLDEGAGLNPLFFGGEKLSLGIQDVEVGDQALGVELGGLVKSAAGGMDGEGKVLFALNFMHIRKKGVFDIGKGGFDGFFIGGVGGKLLGLAKIDGGLNLAEVDDGPANRGAEGGAEPELIAGGGFKKGDLLKSRRTGEEKAGEEIGGGDADAGGGGAKVLFSLANVGAAAKKIGRKADGNGRRGDEGKTRKVVRGIAGGKR